MRLIGHLNTGHYKALSGSFADGNSVERTMFPLIFNRTEAVYNLPDITKGKSCSYSRVRLGNAKCDDNQFNNPYDILA